MLDHRREDQDGQRQEQTDPKALLEFRDHETVIVAYMTRTSVMCLMATMSAIGVHVVHLLADRFVVSNISQALGGFSEEQIYESL